MLSAARRHLSRVFLSAAGAFLALSAAPAHAGINCTQGAVIGQVSFGWGYYRRSGADLYANGGVARAYCDTTNMSTIDMAVFGGYVDEGAYGSGPNSAPPPDPNLLPDLDRIRVPLSTSVDIAVPNSKSTIVNGSGCVGNSCSYQFVRGMATYACTVGHVGTYGIVGYDMSNYGAPIYDYAFGSSLVGEPYDVQGGVQPIGCFNYVGPATYYYVDGYSSSYSWYQCDSGGSLYGRECATPNGGAVRISSTAGGGAVFTLNFTLPGVTALPPTSITATDYVYTDRVQVDINIPADPTCTSVDTIIARDGTDVQTINNGVVSAARSVQWLDYAASPGAHTYAARNVCHVNAQAATSTLLSDAGSTRDALPPTSITATDYVYTDRVQVDINIPADPTCTSVDTIIARDGTDVQTINSGVVSAATSVQWLDYGASPGAHTYAARNVCHVNAHAATSTLLSDAGSKRYASPTCSAITPAQASVAYSNMGTMNTTISGVADATGARVVAYGLLNGANDLTSYTGAGAQPTFTAAVALDNHAPGSPEYGTIRIEAHLTGLNPDETDVTCAVSSFTMSSPPPSNIVATDGTILDAVSVTWTAVPGVSTYQVVECPNVVGEPVFAGPGNSGAISVGGSACAPVGSPVNTPAFLRSGLTGTTHDVSKYAVYGIGADTTTYGAISTSDTGYPDRAPSAATATGSMPYGATGPLNIAAVVTDVNTPETFTLSTPTTTTSFGGTISAVGSTIVYTPPSTPQSGIDTFTFVAADKAGATVMGTGSVDVGCDAPTIGAAAVLPSRVLPNAGYRITVAYGNKNCPHPTTADVSIKTGPIEVATQHVASVAAAMSGTLNVDMTGIATAGPYSATITITDTVDGTTATRTVPFVVSPFQMPTLIPPAAAIEFIEAATLAANGTPDCATTNVDADAAADHTMCLLVATGLPTGVVPVAGATRPTWAGVASPAGTYPVTVSVEQYDPSGQRRVLGTIPTTMVIAPLSSMVFASPTPLDVKQHLKIVTMTVAQSAGPTCALITDPVAAQAFAASGSRRCLLRVPTVPTGFTATPSGITGVVHTSTGPTVPWTVSIFDVSGVEHTVASGSVDMNVTAPSIAYRLAVQPSAPSAGVSNTTIQLAPSSSDTCPLTADVSVASNPTSSLIYCLVEWGTPPAGLSQPAGITLPMLRGVFTNSGTLAVPFTMSVYGPGPTKYEVFAATPTVDVAPPPTPAVVLVNMREISPDVYYVPLDGGFYGNIANCPSCGALTVTQTTAGDATPRTMSIISPSGRQTLVGSPAGLWQQRSATLRVALANAPSYFAEKSFTLVSVPPTDSKVLLTIPGPDVPDNSPVSLRATVGSFGTAGFGYDGARLGQWRVRFGTQDANGNFTPLTSYINTDATGVASGTVDPAGQLVMKLVAQAEPISPVPGYTGAISSFVRVVRVVKGTPVSAHLDVAPTSGPAPLMTVIKVVYDTRADQVANESVHWSRSNDGGSTWNEIADFVNPILITRIQEGSAMFKAHFVNHNTSVASESAPVTVTAFGVPQVVLTGDIYSFPGTSATVNATARRPDSTPIPDAVFEWTVAPRSTTSTPSTPIASGSGPTAAFTSPVAGVFIVKYRARLATSPASDPRSWGERTQQIIFDGEQKPYIRVIGPIRAEVGKTYTYTASVTAPFPIANSPLTIGGEWTLPDGSKVSGNPLNWTPTTADLAAGTSARVRYSAWINGYEASTTSVAYTTVQLWQYVFPTWRVVSQLGSTVAPAGVTVAVMADNPLLVSAIEGLTFTWNLPSEVRVVGTPASKLTGIVDYGGTYPISVTVSDARGNSQLLDATVSVNNPAPFVMDVAVSKISKWSHAPLTVGFTPKVTGGHPTDSILTWQYFVDGVQQTSLPNRAGVQITFDSPGSYSVESRGLSKMGATVSKTVVANVPANVAATCSIVPTVSSNRTQISVKAVCSDLDGAIVRYDWSVNGAARTGVAGLWTYMIPTGTPFPFRFDLTVTDDGGATSSSSATVN